jgi:large repetitive protein
MNNSMWRARVCRFPQRSKSGLLRGLVAKPGSLATLASFFAGIVFLSGCGGSGGPSITVQITPAEASVDQGQTLSFTANLANDLRNQGVTWTLSGASCAGITGAGTSGCGSLSDVAPTAVTYTAPSGLSGSLSVTLTATAIANANATKTSTITVELPLTFSTTTPLPNASNGVAYSQAISATGGVTPLKYSLASGSAALPAGLQLNQSGAITGRPSGPISGQPNPAIFTVQVTDSSTTPVSATEQYSIFVSPAPTLAITAVSPLQTGFVNSTYNTFISTTGGVRPFTWTMLSGALPPGLSFDTSKGQITGVPTTASATPYSFVVQVTDSTLPASQTVQKSLAISVQQPAPLSISPSSLPSGLTASPYSAALSASGGIQPYTWAITDGQLPPGLQFNTATGAITGTPVLATTSTFTVQVTDSEVTPATLSAPYSISVAAGTNSDSLISGAYSFLFQGYDSDGAVALGGSITADGSGKIVGGGMDSNRVSGVVSRATLTGTYSVGTDGRGTMELVATNTLGITLTLDFNLALDSNGNIHFFEDNSTTTNNDPKKTHGSGIMKPSIGSFGGSSFNGNYAFVFTGADSAGVPTALGGVVHADGAGNIGTAGSGANGDYNEGGTFSSQLQVTGIFSFDSGTHGAASLTFELPGKSAYTLTYSFDFVSASDIFFVGTDTTDATHPRLSGEMILQSTSTSFNSSALSAPSVASGTGLDGSNSSVFAGLLTPVPSNTPNCTPQVANCVTMNYDENNGGAVSSPSLIGNYQISANGRAAFTFNAVNGGQLTPVSTPRMAVAYLYGPGQAFTMGSDKAVTTGRIEQQTGVAFANSSILDSYTLSAAFPVENQVDNVIGETTASGTGSILGTLDEVTPPPTSSLSQSVTPNLGQSLVASYASISALGRGTLTTNSPVGFPTNLVIYIVSPASFRAVSVDTSDQHPEVFFFDH